MKDKDKKKKTDQSDKESLEKSDSVDDEVSAVEVEETQKSIGKKAPPASESTTLEESSKETEIKSTPEESPETMPISLVEEGKQLRFLASLKDNKLLLIGLVVGILVLAGGGIFLYRKKSSKPPQVPETAQITPSSQAEAETAPEETPKPTTEPLDRGDLKVQVLNGSGVTGTAGKAKEFLEDLGYKDIKTGNADSYDYEKTEVSIKEDKKDYLELLADDLSEKYVLAEETKTLDEKSEFDVIVILGKG